MILLVNPDIGVVAVICIVA